MHTWLPKVLYFIFIIVVTFFVTNYAESTKVLNFSDAREEYMLESNYELIQTTTLTRHNNNTNAIIKIEPLFNEKYESADGKYSFELTFYAYTEFLKNDSNNALSVVLNDLDLTSTDLFISENNKPIIDVKITYDEPLIYEDESYDYSEETFLNVFDSDNTILLFNYDVLKGENGFLNIKSMELSYRTKYNDNRSLLVLSNSELEPLNYEGVFGETFDRDIKSVTYNNVNIFKDFTIEELKNNDNFYFNDQLTKILKSYNKHYFYSLGIEFLIVIPLTYFLFIHKDFKNYLKNRKNKPEKEQ